MARTSRYPLIGLPHHSDPSYPRLHYQATRLIAIGLLGGRCAHCGHEDTRVLQFDHVNDDGNLERVGGRRPRPGKAIAAVVNGEREKYQLLCANCNWIKYLQTL
jgi:hypothetical protein